MCDVDWCGIDLNEIVVVVVYEVVGESGFGFGGKV